MLFLFSPGGMGIAPIIKLSVVSRMYIRLLVLPRFHGFGSNESQPAGHIHRRRIFQWGLGLGQYSCEDLRLLGEEYPNILRALGTIARFTRQSQIARPMRTPLGSCVNMFDLKRHRLRLTVGALPFPLLEQVFAHLIAC